MNYRVNVFWSDEDKGYIADLPELQACSAFGVTRAEALAELARAQTAWLAAARAEGKPIPVPRNRPGSD